MTQSENKLIAIIGTGKIGKAVSHLMEKAGHSIIFGSRNPDKLDAIKNKPVVDIASAAKKANIVVLAVPYDAIENVVSTIYPHVINKLIIDASNPFSLSEDNKIASSLPSGITAGSRMAQLLPSSNIARAFTHIMDELLVSRGTTQANFWAMAYAANNQETKIQVEDLIKAAGFVPVFVGNLLNSSPLDPGGSLFPHMFTPAEMQEKLSQE